MDEGASRERVRAPGAPRPAEPPERAPAEGAHPGAERAPERGASDERASERAELERVRMAALGRMASGIVHDFGNLLTALRLHAEHLRRQAPAGGVGEGLETLVRTIARGGELVGRLVPLVRGTACVPERVRPAALLRDVAELARQLVRDGTRVRDDDIDDVPDVLADAGGLQQSLLNLVLNARDACGGRGTVTLGARVAEAAAVRAAGLAPGRCVELSVSDDGAGLDESARARALEPFFSTKPPGAGCGLGLTLVHDFVRGARGGLIVESTPGRGTRVAMVLPVAAGGPTTTSGAGRSDVAASGAKASDAGASGAGAAAYDTGASGAPPSLAGREVLLVEDDEGVRALLTQVLGAAGLRVHAAADGADAARLLDADAHACDVVVTDLVLPDGPGTRLIEHVRARRPAVPVIVMTGRDDAEEDARAAGAAAVLVKPFGSQELIAAIEGALAEAGGVRTRR